MKNIVAAPAHLDAGVADIAAKVGCGAPGTGDAVEGAAALDVGPVQDLRAEVKHRLNELQVVIFGLQMNPL